MGVIFYVDVRMFALGVSDGGGGGVGGVTYWSFSRTSQVVLFSWRMVKGH